MSALLAVVLLEARERGFVLVGALAASVLPILVPLIPGLAKLPIQDVREAAAGLVTLLLIGLLAVAFGATAFPLSPSDRRMGFYFHRPVPAWALWLGKMGTDVVLVVICGLIIMTPAWMAEGLTGKLRPEQVLVSIDMWPLLLLLPASHLGSVVVRSRSAWVLADVLIALTFLTGWAYVTLRVANWAYDELDVMLSIQALSWGVCLTAASALCVIVGRMDVRVARRWMSIPLWSCMAVGLLVGGGYLRWSSTPQPDDIEKFHFLAAAPDGPWIAFSGPCRGGWNHFLYNTETGEHVRLGRMTVPLTFFSDAGDTAAWFAYRDAGRELLVADLRVTPPAPRATGLFVEHDDYWVWFAPSGTHVAVRTDLGIELLDVRYPRAVEREDRVLLPPAERTVFLDDRRVRLLSTRPAEEKTVDLMLQDFDMETGRQLAEILVAGLPSKRNRLACSTATARSRDVFVLDERNGGRVTLRDSNTGEEQSLLVNLLPGTRCRIGLLSDDRVVVGAGSDATTRVGVFDSGGTPMAIVELPETDEYGVLLGAEVSPGRFVVGLTPVANADDEPLVYLVDANSGDARVVAEGLRPVSTLRNDLWIWRQMPAMPNSPASRLFVNVERTRLVRLDPATGKSQVVLGGGRSP